jgi:carboxymethylenebutenolidase
MSAQSRYVDVPTQDGVADAILAVPAVLMYMDAYGLRPQMEAMARRVADQGYVVLAPNVFYRSARSPIVDPEEISDPERGGQVFARLRPLIGGLTPDLLARDAASYLSFLRQQPGVDAGPIGTCGYCMGGVLAVRTAAAEGDEVAAVATFHAGRMVTDDDDSPHRLAPRLSGAHVYVGHADHDQSMPREAQQQLTEAFESAGVDFSSELYADARHGFTMADLPVYDEAAAEQAYERMFALFGRALPVSQGM